jgi:hypothetical protein
MRITLKLADSNAVISNDIINALIPQVNDYLVKSINNLKIILPPVIRQAIITTPEYESILNGQLKYEFGIPNSGSKLVELLDLWTSRVIVDYNRPRNISKKIKASFSVSMIRADFSDILGSEAAMVTDNLRGYSLPWLEWLLLYGNKTIVKNYGVIVGPNKRSRTGIAVMRESKFSWRVPSQYAGTISDNWITRAIDSAEDSIYQVIDKALDI